MYGSLIRFRCPRCMADLKARAMKAGTRQRCPRCQFVFKVPSAEEAAARAARRSAAGEYAFWDAAKDPADRQQPYIKITCRVCATRMDATADQVGQQIVCPDCGTTVVVCEPKPQEDKPGAIVAGTDDEYALCESADQPDASNPVVHQTYIPMTCPVCGTRTLGTLDQVGQAIPCPDCQVPMVVPPPSEAPPVVRPPELEIDRHDEYGLIPGGDQPSASGVTYVKVECPHCHTRLPATADQAGTQIVCPDCGTTTMVPEPQAPAPKPALEIPPGEEYAVSPEVVTREYPNVEPNRWPDRSDAPPAGAAAPDESEPPPAPRPKSPRWTFFSGILSFPAYPGVWQRWVAFSATAIPVLLVASTSLQLMSTSAGLAWFPAMGLLATAGLAALLWSAPAAAVCVVIVEETSEGNDAIEEWPEALSTDWMFSVLYLFNSLGAATGAGVLLRGVLREYLGLDCWAVAPATIIVIFPILLLSMLETNSALNVLSWPIWRSLLAAWWAWLVFYLESTVLVAASIALTASAFALVGLWGVAAIAPVLVAAMLIYARLLGRLAWVCQSAAEAEESPEEE